MYQLLWGQSNTLLIFNPITLSSALLKNTPDVLFRTDSQFHAIEDWLLWVELALSGRRYGFLKESLLEYRVHEESISVANGERQYRKGFCLYSVLFLEDKIRFPKFLALIVLQSARLLKYRLFGRH